MFSQPLIPASILRLLPLVVVGPLSAGCVMTGAEGRYVEREERRFALAGGEGKDARADVKEVYCDRLRDSLVAQLRQRATINITPVK